MADFSGMQLTNLGLDLLARAQTGTPIAYTRVAIGDGQLGEEQELAELTALINQVMNVNLIGVSRSGNQVRVKTIFNNSAVADDFYLREIGLFAQNPDVPGGELLYAVANAGATADLIPAAGGAAVEKVIDLITVVGNAETVTATIDESAVGIPTGGIIMWSGAANNLPAGWGLCDGAGGRPDLRGKFVLGAGGAYEVGAGGGAETHTLITAQMPAHQHRVKSGTRESGSVWGFGNAQSKQGFGGTDNAANLGWYSQDAAGNVLMENTGGGQSHNNMPPYFALCFIIKL